MSAFSEHSPPLMSSGGAHSKVPWKLVIIVLSFTSILDRPTSCNEQFTVMRKTRTGLEPQLRAGLECNVSQNVSLLSQVEAGDESQALLGLTAVRSSFPYCLSCCALSS